MKTMKARVISILAALVVGVLSIPSTSQAASTACTTVIASSPIVRGDWSTGQGSYPITTVVIRFPVCLDKWTGMLATRSSPSLSFKNTAAGWSLKSVDSVTGASPIAVFYYDFNTRSSWRLSGAGQNSFFLAVQSDLQVGVYSSAFVQACARIASASMTNVRNSRVTTPQWSCVLMSRK